MTRACRRPAVPQSSVNLVTGAFAGVVNWTWEHSPVYWALEKGWDWLARMVIPLDDDRPIFEPELY